jgi:hypothetical protein
MSKVFVSYRREDAQGEAGHLLADLRRRFGEAQVFMDIAAIGPGEDFGLAIERAMADCSVVLVVIGRSWVDVRDAQGARRLDNPSDWVRLEVESALNGDRKVIPVLVQGASMPHDSMLPASMAALARRNAHEISARRWDYDFDALAKTLMEPLGMASADGVEAGVGRQSPNRRARPAAWAAALAAVAAVGYFAVKGLSPAPPPASSARSPTPFALGDKGSTSVFGGKSRFDDTLEYRMFTRLTTDLSTRAELNDAETKHFVRTTIDACPDLLQRDCGEAVQSQFQKTSEAICANRIRATSTTTSATEFTLLQKDGRFLSCVQQFISEYLDGIDKRAKSAIQAIKPG